MNSSTSCSTSSDRLLAIPVVLDQVDDRAGPVRASATSSGDREGDPGAHGNARPRGRATVRGPRLSVVVSSSPSSSSSSVVVTTVVGVVAVTDRVRVSSSRSSSWSASPLVVRDAVIGVVVASSSSVARAGRRGLGCGSGASDPSRGRELSVSGAARSVVLDDDPLAGRCWSEPPPATRDEAREREHHAERDEVPSAAGS